ncbi:zinc finger protein PLAG1-like [Achroia grisella]|uniref:zinc finger protein PLAG1-like n=1 Tax=Achroia grisella TaxID=688607 RepID=UPI0027D34BAE|nr:zinc finger protein PLAG1-like [Achroia grisella]
MASPPPNPREGEEGGSEFTEESSGERATTPQKTFIAPPASQLPTKLQFVALGAPGPSGSIKQCFRTVKAARRVPTLPRRPREGEAAVAGTSAAGSAASEPERRTRRDRSKRHVCTTCDKRFSSPGKLSQHVLSHTGELPFSCNLCNKRFNSKFKLVRHNLIHSEARAFACITCGKTFNRKDHLTNHERVHNPAKRLYTCDKPDCKKSYTSSLSFRKHAALHSAEEGNLQCIICDEVFSTQQDIVYHLKVHTGSRTVKNETDKKFTCDYCDRRFFTAKDVRRHLVVHTGRRDFLCPHCPQKFGRKDHLVRHVKNAHPEESWKSAAVGTSSEPPPQASTSFEETYTDFQIEGSEYPLWKPPSPKESMPEGQTRVPSSEIIVEIPPELKIKVEPDIKLEDPLEIKLEEPVSPSCELIPSDYPVMFIVPSSYSQTPSNLPYMTTQPMQDTMTQAHLLNPAVPSLLVDPGEGPSGLSSEMLGLLDDNEPTSTPTYTGEEGRQQRLPAFTQAFQTAQSPKPPPPPPPSH